MQLLNDVLNKFYLSIENDGFIVIEKLGNISEDVFNTKPLSLIFDKKVEVLLHSVSVFLVFICITYIIYNTIISKSNTDYINFKIIIQIIVITIISLNSYGICKEIVVLNSTFTIGIEELLEGLIDEEIKFTSLKKNINTLEEYLKEQDKVSLLGIKDGIIFCFLILLIIVFSVRYVYFILLVIISPIFILCLLNSSTHTLFYKWLKYFCFSISVQNVNKILLFICISAKEQKDIYGCILLGTIILVYKLNRRIGDI